MKAPKDEAKHYYLAVSESCLFCFSPTLTSTPYIRFLEECADEFLYGYEKGWVHSMMDVVPLRLTGVVDTIVREGWAELTPRSRDSTFDIYARPERAKRIMEWNEERALLIKAYEDSRGDRGRGEMARI